jgi:hypothetical protein
MAFEVDEDEVSWRDPATDGAGAPVLVPSDRLAGTAGDARISERAGAESRKGIPYIHGL